jgi:hypothetical protein
VIDAGHLHPEVDVEWQLAEHACQWGFRLRNHAMGWSTPPWPPSSTRLHCPHAPLLATSVRILDHLIMNDLNRQTCCLFPGENVYFRVRMFVHGSPARRTGQSVSDVEFGKTSKREQISLEFVLLRIGGLLA